MGSAAESGAKSWRIYDPQVTASSQAEKVSWEIKVETRCSKDNCEQTLSLILLYCQTYWFLFFFSQSVFLSIWSEYKVTRKQWNYFINLGINNVRALLNFYLKNYCSNRNISYLIYEMCRLLILTITYLHVCKKTAVSPC